MKRFTLLICCLMAIACLGFWRLVAQPEPSIHAQDVASVQVVDHRRMEQIERHLDELIHEAEKLEDAGKHEHAERVQHEINRIEKHLHQMHEHAERAEHHEPAHHFAEAEQKRDHLLEAAQNLRYAGKPELAEQLYREAGKVEQHLHEMREAEQAGRNEEEIYFTEAGQKRNHMLQMATHLIRAAENLRHADKPELAEQLQHEAEEIERHLQHLREREHGHHPRSSLEPIMHELHGLRKEVAELREQIHELHEVIEEAIEEHGDEDEAETDGEEDLDISMFELEPGTDPIINANGLKIFIQQLGKQQEKGTHGKVQVHGKVQIKRGDSEDVQVFVFDQDDLEAGDLSKMLDLNEVELGTGLKGLNLKSIIEQAVGKIPSTDKKADKSKKAMKNEKRP